VTDVGFEIRRVRTAGELLDAYAVRRNVFIVEQQVPESIERDELDKTAEHVVAYVDGVAAGAGRLVLEGTVGRVGRMAVRAPARGRGIGAGVLAQLEEIARERGCASVELHAQLTAQDFYARNGYLPVGSIFREAEIAHVAMFKRLDA
jgi:predicted GNAT family N-acyltransferase